MQVRTIAALVLVGSILPGAAGAAEEAAAEAETRPNGRAVMERVDARPRGRDFSASARWRLIDRNGRERKRETRIYRKTGDRTTYRSKWLVLVDGPRLVQGIGLLVWSGVSGGDEHEQWLYLPGYRKVRRIAGSDRGQAFLGSDFAFGDLIERNAAEDFHERIADQTIEGRVYAVVESRPRNRDDAYGKRLHWVDPSNWTIRRIELYDRGDRPDKTFDAQWQEIGGIWAWKQLEMATHRTGSRTVIEVDSVKHDQGLDDALFTKSSLRYGPP